jgi:hypothetical protein
MRQISYEELLLPLEPIGALKARCRGLFESAGVSFSEEDLDSEGLGPGQGAYVALPDGSQFVLQDHDAVDEILVLSQTQAVANRTALRRHLALAIGIADPASAWVPDDEHGH